MRQRSSPCSPRGGGLAGTGRDTSRRQGGGEGCAGMSQDTGRCFPTVSARSARTNTRPAATPHRTHRRTHSPAPKLGHVTEWPLPGLVAGPRTGKQAHTGPGMMTYSRVRVRRDPGEPRPREERLKATCGGGAGRRHVEAPARGTTRRHAGHFLLLNETASPERRRPTLTDRPPRLTPSPLGSGRRL